MNWPLVQSTRLPSPCDIWKRLQQTQTLSSCRKKLTLKTHGWMVEVQDLNRLNNLTGDTREPLQCVTCMQTPLSLSLSVAVRPWLKGCVLPIAYIFYMEVCICWCFLCHTVPTFASMYSLLLIFFINSVGFHRENAMVK